MTNNICTFFDIWYNGYIGEYPNASWVKINEDGEYLFMLGEK